MARTSGAAVPGDELLAVEGVRKAFPGVVALDNVQFRLRPGTVVGKGAKVGTYVEVKNSEIGAGAKVPHLSYIGDTEVGEKANLGASTITANYDGRRKHRTKIGKSAKTGVHTSLVAPVDVGDRSYTGAGSVITGDIPEGALGIARERQKNVEGYADRVEEDPQ